MVDLDTLTTEASGLLTDANAAKQRADAKLAAAGQPVDLTPVGTIIEQARAVVNSIAPDAAPVIATDLSADQNAAA